MPEYQNNVVSSSDQSENTNNKLENSDSDQIQNETSTQGQFSEPFTNDVVLTEISESSFASSLNTNNKLETQSAENSAIKTIDERVRINIHK